MGDSNSFDVQVAQIDAAKELTAAVLSKVLLPITEPENASSTYVNYVGEIYKGIHKAVANPGE